MGFLSWLENSQLGDYMRVSAYGYAAMLTLHSIGLAVMVGLSAVISLRALGILRGLPYEALPVFLKIAWIGFIVNFVSGTLLFAMQATEYVTDREFLLKIAFVFLGALSVALLQAEIGKGVTAASGRRAAGRARAIYAIATLVSWSLAMIAGRLIAYI